MITRPPMILTQGLLIMVAPTRPAVVPSARKMRERPALNASEFRMTALRALVPSLSRSTLMPDISDMYPGTSGKTHGERNDSMPAAKAIQIVMFESDMNFFAISVARLIIRGVRQKE